MIVDVEATPARTYDEVAATKTMIERTEASFGLKPLEITEDTLGLDAIREVGPGGHFFGAAHTLARYTDAFYAPLVSDWRNYQQWAADGRPEAWQKANALWKQALAEYEPPPLDPAIAEELDTFVARRTEQGGAPTDF